MAELIEVRPFSFENLKEFLFENVRSKVQAEQKNHVAYLNDYLTKISAKTILAEREYVDRDFLEDFSAYYVRCFNEPRRLCVRLHFFSVEVVQADIDAFLKALAPDKVKLLQGNYLGFLVVKPLPFTLVGRTCLHTYDDANGRRFFPVCREYEVNLLGVPLKINSLAYQEQDHVVAACATSALWSVFQKTGKKFQHAIPSPVEITKSASLTVPLESRTFPNKGLNTQQIAQAIRTVGLEPYVTACKSNEELVATAYAYLKGAFPVLYGFLQADNLVVKGGHAVAVTGYSLGISKPVSSKQPKLNGFCLKAFRIDKIYVHDDQIGPNARMVLDPAFANFDMGGGKFEQKESLTSSVYSGAIRAIDHILFFPLYHKIRIPFSFIQDLISPLDRLLELIRTTMNTSWAERLEWDIYLTTANDLKQEIMKSTILAEKDRRDILLARLPRYIWRASATSAGKNAFEFIFDATGIEQDSLLVHLIVEDKTGVELLVRALNSMPLAPYFSASEIWPLIEWLKANNPIPVTSTP